MLRVTRLFLRNWRNFVSLDVSTSGRVFLIGPNAAGKSNLLNALRFLRDLVAVGGGFQAAVVQRGGVSRLRALAARRYPAVEIRVSIGTAAEPEVWRYELAFSQDNRQRATIQSERVVHAERGSLLSRPNSEDEADRARLIQTYLEQVQVNQEFRELAEFFATIQYQHVVPQLVRESDRWRAKADDPFGSTLLEKIARTNKQTRTSRLTRIREALAVAVPQLNELKLDRDERGSPHLLGRYEHWRAQGALQSEEQFSDGTLRLLGLLWFSLEGAGPLLLEEPELSLHPEVVRYLPQMFARLQRRTGRQIWISTHSPEMLRDPGIGLDEVLILRPAREGTTVEVAGDVAEFKPLLDAGMTLADLVMPRTRPEHAEQLALYIR